MRKREGFFMDRRTIIDAATRLRAAELYDERPMAMGRKYARYSYETKLAAARTVVDGGMTWAEAMEGFGIASTTPLKNWVRAYREGGPEALRPKPRGGPPGPPPRGADARAGARASHPEARGGERLPKKSIALKAEKRLRTARRKPEGAAPIPPPTWAGGTSRRDGAAGWRGRASCRACPGRATASTTAPRSRSSAT